MSNIDKNKVMRIYYFEIRKRKKYLSNIINEQNLKQIEILLVFW